MKRLAATIIAVYILLLPVHISAETQYILSYDRAEALMNLNNGTLKKLARVEKDALRDYKSNAQEAENLDTDGFNVNYGGEDHYIYYDMETHLLMIKAKELYPEQTKYAWEAARDNRTITTNSLKASLRGVYFAVYNANADLKLKQKQFELTAEMNKQDGIKLKSGLITKTTMQESDYNLKKAENSLNASKRNYENVVRNFNQFVGVSPKTQYTDVVFEDKLPRQELKPVDYYIERALSNRFDILSISKQIELKEKEKKLDETYIIPSSTAVDQLERLVNDIGQLNIDLESMKISITDEIRNAYVDVMKAEKSVNSIGNTLKLQQSSYNKMLARYKAGLVSKNMLTQSEIGLIQVENGYRATLYDYNTKIIRFNNAAAIGPEY